MSDLIGGGITPVTYNSQGLYSTIIIKDKLYVKDVLEKIKEEIKIECAWDYNCNVHIDKILEIIDKHLQEVEDNGGQ